MFLGKYKLLGLDLTVCNHGFILEEIERAVKKKKKLLIAPLASQTFVLAQFDKALFTILSSYTYLFSDSVWVKRAANFLYKLEINRRIRGSNLLLNVASFSERRGYKLFLYGTNDRTLKLLKNKLCTIYSRLKIVGVLPSKFKHLPEFEKISFIENLKLLHPQILFIALGSPLQEIFAYDLIFKTPKIDFPLIVIPVGAAFDFVSGVKPQAPKWMQENGMEWLFRFIHEPKRLWKRYLIYGPLFILLVLKQKLKMVSGR